ncbi:MAG: helix-turn-helix transcriptional regulator [Phycisphaerales bacterium]|nr:helix-turn-helix transcriptional regulator [Phycisphaerales bacterium]
MREKIITNNIRMLRFLNGEMTQSELRKRVGVTRQTIAAIEAGKYSPSLEAAFGIAEVLGKRLDEVFAWGEIENEESRVRLNDS